MHNLIIDSNIYICRDVMKNRLEKFRMLQKMRRNVSFFDKRIKHRNLYNFKNSCVSVGVEVFYIGYRFSPIILSFVSLFYVCPKGHKPFIFDKKVIYAYERMVNTSNGVHFEDYNFTDKYLEQLEYFSSWNYLENLDVYERVVINYYTDKVDFNDLDSVFLLNQKELAFKFGIKDVNVITTTELSNEDGIYFEDFICVIDVSSGEQRVVQQGIVMNVMETFFYIYCSFLLSFGVYRFHDYFFDDTFYKNILLKFKFISDKDIHDFERILKVYKENFDMLNEKSSSNIRRIKKRED